jgi:hypothetical protein
MRGIEVLEPDAGKLARPVLGGSGAAMRCCYPTIFKGVYKTQTRLT